MDMRHEVTALSSSANSLGIRLPRVRVIPPCRGLSGFNAESLHLEADLSWATGAAGG